MSRQIIIVGPSGSGKTTVAELVAHDLALPFISMDVFRARGYHRIFYALHDGRRIRNYEDIRCWDGNALSCKLRWHAETGSGFVAEGNHLLAYPEIAAIRADRYYIDVPHAVSVERRATRHRHSPADESFLLIGEAMTRRIVAPQKSLPDVCVLDGTLPVANLVAAILQPVPA